MLATRSGEWLSCGPSFWSMSGHLHLQSHQRFTGKRSLYICFSPFTVRSHSIHTELFLSASISFALASIVYCLRDISKFQVHLLHLLHLSHSSKPLSSIYMMLLDGEQSEPALSVVCLTALSACRLFSWTLDLKVTTFTNLQHYKCVSPDLNWWRLSSHLQITII